MARTCTVCSHPEKEEIEYRNEHGYAQNVDYTHIEEGWYIVEEAYNR